MCEAFDILRAQNRLRLCIFIDGLDEYEADAVGTHTNVVTLFKTIVTSTNIKICRSSRLLLLFEDAFSSAPSLQIQNLSSNNVNQHVEDKLYSNHRMIQLQDVNPFNTDFLVKEIVSKASGVFLWVILAVKSLMESLANRDRSSDLRRRLELLLADLEDLYKHMLLKQIHPFYPGQADESSVLAVTPSFRDPTLLASRSLLHNLEVMSAVLAVAPRAWVIWKEDVIIGNSAALGKFSSIKVYLELITC